jgi:malate synthase
MNSSTVTPPVARAGDSRIVGGLGTAGQEILTAEAVDFVTSLARRFAPAVRNLLEQRARRQAEFDRGVRPDFPAETRTLRDSDWRVGAIPADLLDRRVEITGPTDRKMVINALNSGASVFMADFEDSLSPTWSNVVVGQQNLRDAVLGTIELRPAQGKHYRLNEKTAVLLVRPRGWHLVEKHWLLDGQPIAAAFVDFGLYLFHNHAALQARGTAPYFYLPKLEGYREARLWAEVFAFAETRLGLAHGTIKATVLIETILAAFELDEILYELRDYVVGLNCGRWDYIFSYIKKFSQDPAFCLPDRQAVTMTTPFLRAYARLVVKVCHRRGALAIGGMAAQIPIKHDPVANEAALAKVRADKEREAGDGHDGTWVAHPALVPIAREVFDRLMPGPNNLHVLREDVVVSAADLLAAPPGEVTEAGLRNNVTVSIRYLASWLGGNGCVPIFNLMEDAATAEIARAQLWQWIHHQRRLADGRAVTLALVRQIEVEELAKLDADVGEAAFACGHYGRAGELVDALIARPKFEEFLTLPAYREID